MNPVELLWVGAGGRAWWALPSRAIITGNNSSGGSAFLRPTCFVIGGTQRRGRGLPMR